MDATSYLLGKKAGGGSGTSNYNDLSNKPSINGVTLSGDKSTSDLGIQIPTVPTNVSAFTNDAGYINDVSGKQDTLVSGTNIKTINNESILGSGNIDISGGGENNYLINTNDGQIRADEETIELLEYIYNNFNTIDVSKIYFKSNNGRSYYNPLYIYKYDDYLTFYNMFNNGAYTQGPYGIDYVTARTVKQDIRFSNGTYVSKTYSGENVYIIKNARNLLSTTNSATYTPTGNYNPSTKLYTDKTHYENMAGYDATKTQVLKNVNGTLTWVDE